MLYGKISEEEQYYLEPIFGSKNEDSVLPKNRMSQHPIEPRVAHQLVEDELLDEGNARMNLATFCQTYMEPEADQIISDTLQKNMIDKSEYPKTAELEQRCVNIVANLWHASDDEKFIGTSTIGSSEACMLSGMAMKFSWRERAAKLGLDINKKKPNLVISSGFQVCWEKFCVYWDIEMRAVPMDKDHMSLNLDTVMDYVDEYTIGIVGIMGITYTGCYDDIKGLNDRVEAYNQTTDYKVYIHVDAASGGLYAPFVQPEITWDFQLDNVISINASGHKYGLVYPGIGWAVWRDEKFLPKELIFNVSYLGGEMPTLAINFSHSASHMIAQYYNFVRFGFEGYQAIHQRTRDVALFISQELEKLDIFEILNDGAELPLVCYHLKEDSKIVWDLYDLADRLAMKGWQVPAYPLPDNLADQVIQRVVVRGDLGMNLAHDFVKDMQEAVKELSEADLSFHRDKPKKSYGFTH